jgi:hypothetical protein
MNASGGVSTWNGIQPGQPGSNYHIGGIAGLPRFHTGLPTFGFGNFLQNDEILSVLKRGERIFSQDDTDELEKTILDFDSGVTTWAQNYSQGVQQHAYQSVGGMGGVHIHNEITVNGGDKDAVKKLKDYLDSDAYARTIKRKAIDAIEQKWNKDMGRNRVR